MVYIKLFINNADPNQRSSSKPSDQSLHSRVHKGPLETGSIRYKNIHMYVSYAKTILKTIENKITNHYLNAETAY